MLTIIVSLRAEIATFNARPRTSICALFMYLLWLLASFFGGRLSCPARHEAWHLNNSEFQSRSIFAVCSKQSIGLLLSV